MWWAGEGETTRVNLTKRLNFEDVDCGLLWVSALIRERTSSDFSLGKAMMVDIKNLYNVVRITQHKYKRLSRSQMTGSRTEIIALGRETGP